MTAALVSARRRVLENRVRIIVAATITWNAIEAIVALVAGGLASSAALIGFGLDSIVEVLSAAAVAWQFSAPDPRRREHTAMRIIAIAFFALAAYVGGSAVWQLATGSEPHHSTPGIIIAALSVVVMPAAAWFETRTGRELGSATAIADARQAMICAYLSAAVLVGLVLNSLLGWGWADGVAAIVIAGFAVREGVNAWGGDACCAGGAAVLVSRDDARENGTCDCCAPASRAVALEEPDLQVETLQHVGDQCCNR